MRYIFITLLLVNIIYFGFHWWKQVPETSAEPGQNGQQGDLIRMLDEGPATARRQVLRAPVPGKGLSRVIRNEARSRDEITADGCPAIGPYLNLLPGQQSLEYVSSLEIPAELVALDIETPASDYRVLMPPLKSLEEAYRKLRELQGRNIDSYVISEGAYALGISLGVFSQPASAEDQQTRLQDMGYQTEVVAVPRILRQYWLVFGPESRTDLAGEVLAGLEEIESSVGPGFKTCPSL